MQTFENYLQDIHASNYMGTDDDMLDNFDNWLSNLDGEEYINYADDYAKEVHNNALKTVEEGLPLKRLERWTVMATPCVDEKAIAFNNCIDEVINNIQKLNI